MPDSIRVSLNIRKNITPYNKGRYDVGGAFAAISVRLLALLIAIAIPIVTLVIPFNIALRVPDVYSFQLGKSQDKLSKMKITLDRKTSAVASEISDYMLHQGGFPKAKAIYKKNKVDLLTAADRSLLSKARAALDVSTVVAIVFLLGAVAASVLLVKGNWRRFSRGSFYVGLVLWLLGLAGMAAFAFVPGVRSFFAAAVPAHIMNGSVVMRTFGDPFIFMLFGVVAVISLIMIFVWGSAIRGATREKKMFVK
jgi:hypothetical protein